MAGGTSLKTDVICDGFDGGSFFSCGKLDITFRGCEIVLEKIFSLLLILAVDRAVF